jgi:hypothetical protein
MPSMNMVIENSSNWKNYSKINNNYNSINNIIRPLGIKKPIAGPMIGRIQFSKSGCSSCGK